MNKFPIPKVTLSTIEKLEQYDWPGNVRELENLVERALILHRSGPLCIEPIKTDMGFCAGSSTEQQLFPQTLAQVIKSHICQVLDMANGRVEGKDGAAELLDVHPSTLRVRMRKLGIAFGKKYKTE